MKRMTDAELAKGIQSRVAKVAIGPSTVREKGNAGIARAVRRLLSSIPLEEFGTKSQAQFRKSLDQTTHKLKRKTRSWGLARKCLNIFLRDSFYNAYLRKEFGLSASESFYEIPLDGITAAALQELTGGALPKWKAVKNLNQSESNVYQEFAASEAKLRGITRVHLDTFLWI